MEDNKFDKKDSPIESLKKSLYSRAGPLKRKERSKFKEKQFGVPEDWEHSSDFKTVSEVTGKRQKPILKFFLVSSIIFFLAALAVAAIVIVRDANVISSRNVDVAVSGSASVPGGEVISLQIEVTNRNRITLETADLRIEFPDGTRKPDDSSKEMKRLHEPLGNIKPGAKKAETIEALVFGEEGEEQQILITVEYRVSGSNAIFVKEKVFRFEISSAPLSLLVDLPAEVNSGQEMSFSVEVVSNATNVIENVLLVAEYPFGFTFDRAVPGPSFDNDVWSLGSIQPGGRKTIQVAGFLEAQDNEERTFRFTGGIESESNEDEIGTPFLTALRTTTIKRPFVEINLAFDGKNVEEYAAGSGESVRADITWRNNLPVQVADLVLEVRLEGEALDKSSVSVPQGFYRSIDNTIMWDKNTNEKLAILEPDDSGRVSFDFRTLDLSVRSNLRNQKINITVDAVGRRLDDPETAGTIESSLTKTVLVSSDLELGARAVHFVGPFENSGPMPPRAEQETSYTVIWSVTNSSNNVSSARVVAKLPSYVQWPGTVSPQSETVSYNPVGGDVIWDLDDVRAGAGYTLPAREVAFQIILVPSVSQIGTSPVIVGESSLTGRDTFSGAAVGDKRSPLTTRLTMDTEFRTDQDKVVE